MSSSSLSSCSSSSSSASCNALIVYGSNRFPYSTEIDPIADKHKEVGPSIYEDEFDDAQLEQTKVWDGIQLSVPTVWTSQASYSVVDGQLVCLVHGPNLGGNAYFYQLADGDDIIDVYTRLDLEVPRNIYGDTSKSPQWPDPRVTAGLGLWEAGTNKSTDMMVWLEWASPAIPTDDPNYWTFRTPPQPSPMYSYDQDDYDWWLYAYKVTYIDEAPWWTERDVYIRVSQPYLYMRLRAVGGAGGEVYYSLTEPTQDSDWTLIDIPTDDFVVPFIWDEFTLDSDTNLYLWGGCNAGIAPVSHTWSYLRGWPRSNWRDYNRPLVNEQSTEQVYSGSYSRKFTAKYRPGDQDPQGIISDSFLISDTSNFGLRGDEFEDGVRAPFWGDDYGAGATEPTLLETDGKFTLQWDVAENNQKYIYQPAASVGLDIYSKITLPTNPVDGIYNSFYWDIWSSDYDNIADFAIVWDIYTTPGQYYLSAYEYSIDASPDQDDWTDVYFTEALEHVWVRIKMPDGGYPSYYYALSEPVTDADWTEIVVGDRWLVDASAGLELWWASNIFAGSDVPSSWSVHYFRSWPPQTADYQLDFWCYPVDRNKVRVTLKNDFNTYVYSFTGLIPNQWNRCTRIITVEEQLETHLAFHSGAQESGTWYIDDVQLRKVTCEGSSSSSSCSSSSSFSSNSSSSFSSCSSCSSCSSSNSSRAGMPCYGTIMDEFNEPLGECWSPEMAAFPVRHSQPEQYIKVHNKELHMITPAGTTEWNHYLIQGFDPTDGAWGNYVGTKLNQYDFYTKVTGPKNLADAGWGTNVQLVMEDVVEWAALGAWLVWGNETGSWQWSVQAWPWYGESGGWEGFYSDYIPLGTGEVTVWIRFRIYPDRSDTAKIYYAATDPKTENDWTEFVYTSSDGPTPPENFDLRFDPAWPYEIHFQDQGSAVTRNNASITYKADYLREWPPTGSLSSCSSSSSSSSSRSCDALAANTDPSEEDFAPFSTTLPNGDMESDTGWNPHGSPVSQGRTTLQKHAGTSSWRFEVDAINEGIVSDPFKIILGANQIRFWVYPVDRTTVTTTVTAGDKTLTERHGGLTANAWNTVIAYFNAQQTYTNARLAFHSGASESGVWFVDDVLVRFLQCSGLREDEFDNDVIEPFWYKVGGWDLPDGEQDGYLYADSTVTARSFFIGQWPKGSYDVWTKVDIGTYTPGLGNSLGADFGWEIYGSHLPPVGSWFGDYYFSFWWTDLDGFNPPQDREVLCVGLWCDIWNHDQSVYPSFAAYNHIADTDAAGLAITEAYVRAKWNQTTKEYRLFWSLTEPTTDDDWTEFVWDAPQETFDYLVTEYLPDGPIADWEQMRAILREIDVSEYSNVGIYAWVNNEYVPNIQKWYFFRFWESPYSFSASSSSSSSYSSCSSCSSSLSSSSSSSSSST